MQLSPLERVEHAYLRHAWGPDKAIFWGGYTTELRPGPIELPELTDILTDERTPLVVKDGVWASLVRLAQATNDEWGVIAAGIAIRGLKRAVTRARYHAPNIDIRDDLESAAISAFLESIETVDTTRPQICARLCQAAYINARRWAIELKQYQQAMCSAVYESHPPPDQYQHVDLILTDAISQGIITKLQASLILETRFDRHTVKRSADGHKLAVPKARKERRIGELQLYQWLTGQGYTRNDRDQTMRS
ncbi:hypothetical protein [Glycomyces tenuis]|uniref:hypothetical protein n=1 Tax=Glycomyces tenuis TaxID=58116 RepID=UPI000409AF6F|nr:hypothetical protein [Glycomyces tenuis]